jgi:hypothetical protein
MLAKSCKFLIVQTKKPAPKGRQFCNLGYLDLKFAEFLYQVDQLVGVSPFVIVP